MGITMAMQIILLAQYGSGASTGYPVCACVVARPIERKEARFWKFLGNACFIDSVWEVSRVPQVIVLPHVTWRTV
jgi:hypothetical protein